MRVIVAIALVLFVFIWSASVWSESRPPVIKPLLGGEVLAQESRVRLARLLYRKGLEMERSGNLADALRYWLNAYNIDTRDKVITDRFIRTFETLLRTVDSGYREALFDLQYGRPERALSRLKAAYALLDGIDSGLSRKIARAMEGRDEK